MQELGSIRVMCIIHYAGAGCIRVMCTIQHAGAGCIRVTSMMVGDTSCMCCAQICFLTFAACSADKDYIYLGLSQYQIAAYMDVRRCFT